jgi:hypothetical protein
MREKAGFILCAVLALTGCVQTRITEPKRSAVEQLLLSQATDRACREIDFSKFNGRKTFMDVTYFEAHDEQYALGAIRDSLSQAGALLVPEIKDAELVVEPRSGALSTDSSSSVVGMPSLPLPIPMSGTLVTPELALYKSQKQLSTSKIALLAYEQESKKHFISLGPAAGTAKHNYYTFLGYFKYTSTTLPEKRSGFFLRNQE